MSSKYNIVSELFRRENGLSNHRSNTFERNILGSPFIAEKMNVSHILDLGTCTNPAGVSFNQKGNLVCIADSLFIEVYDWKANKLVRCFYSGHKLNPDYLNLINTDNGGLDIISACEDGQIRRAQISSTGSVTSKTLFYEKYSHPKLTAVPSSTHELVGVTFKGKIFLMDLRCSKPICLKKKNVLKDMERYMRPYDIAYHPFASEFCIAGDNKYLRIFDRRNLSQCAQEMCPKGVRNRIGILQCSYNYNGDDIQALYYGEGVYLFNSRNYTPGDYLARYQAGSQKNDQCEFFGPKSEYVLCTAGNSICFFHKNSGKLIIRKAVLPGKKDGYNVSLTGVISHPSLPVIVTKTWDTGVLIWALNK